MTPDRTEAEVLELLDAVDGVVLALDAYTLAVKHVSGAREQLGWPDDVWRSSRFWTDVMHPLEAEKTAALFAGTARDGIARRSVHRMRTSTGAEHWYRSRVRALRATAGRPPRLVVLMTDISEPLTEGSSLARRDDLQRRVIEQLPAIVYTTDRDLRVTSGAGAPLGRLGLRPQQLLGVSLAEYLQTDDPDHPALLFHRRALAGESLTYDQAVHGVLFENHLGPLRDDLGAIVGTLGVCHEVTELRRGVATREEQATRLADQQRMLANALGRRAAEWEAVLKSIVDGVVVFDAEGNIRFINESGARAAAAATSGPVTHLSVMEREELLQLRDADEKPLGEPISKRVLRGETIDAIEVAYTATNNRRRCARVSGAPLHVDGKRVGGVIVAHDITRLKHYAVERERMLLEATERAAETQSILDHLVDGVLVVSPLGEVELANREARRLLGLPTRDGLTLHDVQRRIEPTLEDGVAKSPIDVACASARAGRVVRNLQFGALDEDNRRATLRMNAGPIGQGRGVVVVVRDVSEIAEFDALKDQFISVAAHELKTPIAVMKGYAQLLMRTPGEPPRAQLEAIDRGAKRIDRVVQELLDVSQLNLGRLSITPGKVDLCALVTSVAEHAPRTLKHHVRVRCGERAVATGDRFRLEFVLANLMDNAIRYSPAGGDIDVTLEVERGVAIVSVRDQGVGIPACKQPRIFERFYRAHTGTPYDYGGMGVALSLSREIVERHGGSLTFESKECVGSTFVVRLPLGGRDG